MYKTEELKMKEEFKKKEMSEKNYYAAGKFMQGF